VRLNVGPIEAIPSIVPTTASNLRAPSPMSRPNNPINAPSHHGAVGYMIERLKGRPSYTCDTSRAKDLELAFKSVAYANELGRLTRTSVQADQAAVHTLLEALEDRIIARFRGLYAEANIVMTKRNPLVDWKYFSFTSIDNILTKISKKQPTGAAPAPFDRDIRKTFFTPLVEASIKALEQRDLVKYPRRPQHQCK
jgi:hypothetical protein